MTPERDSNDEAGGPLVTGQILFTAQTPSFRQATVHLYLEDVSYADAEAEVIAEAVIPAVHHDPTRGESRQRRATTVPFVIDAPAGMQALDERNLYAVRVWVDRDGDGLEGPGDLFSDQSYRVLTRGFGRRVSIRLGPR